MQLVGASAAEWKQTKIRWKPGIEEINQDAAHSPAQQRSGTRQNNQFEYGKSLVDIKFINIAENMKIVPIIFLLQLTVISLPSIHFSVTLKINNICFEAFANARTPLKSRIHFLSTFVIWSSATVFSICSRMWMNLRDSEKKNVSKVLAFGSMFFN